MLAKIMTGQQQSLFSAMNTNCQRSWWHMTTKRTAKMWDFLNFFLVNINVKLRLCILSPNHGAAKQTLALPVTAARLLWFGIRGVGLLVGVQESSSGTALSLLPLPFTLASGENFALSRGKPSLAGRWSPWTGNVKFTVLSLPYSNDSAGAAGYSMIFSLCSSQTLCLHHFASHFAQSYLFLSPRQASLLCSLWSG